MRDVLTVGEAAVELKTIESRLRRLFREKLLPDQWVGVTRVVRRADLAKVRALTKTRFPKK
jgi:hypothetical protein